jgi:hypothetical protein
MDCGQRNRAAGTEGGDSGHRSAADEGSAGFDSCESLAGRTVTPSEAASLESLARLCGAFGLDPEHETSRGVLADAWVRAERLLAAHRARSAP